MANIVRHGVTQSRTSRSDRGVAVVAVLYALSIFSVLALTVLTNADVARDMRLSLEPDLHLVLYVGGAGSPKIVGRVNMPTLGPGKGPHAERPGVSVVAPAPANLRS